MWVDDRNACSKDNLLMIRKLYSFSIVTMLAASGVWLAPNVNSDGLTNSRSRLSRENVHEIMEVENVEARKKSRTHVLGRPDRLQKSYRIWKERIPKGEEHLYTIDLLPSKAFGAARSGDVSTQVSGSKAQNAEASRGRGIATLDFKDQKIHATVEGLQGSEDFELWLLAQPPEPAFANTAKKDNHGITQEPVMVGKFVAKGNQLQLEGDLQQDLEQAVAVDWVALVRAGETPMSGGVLYGAPSLFQRVHFAEQATTRKQIGTWAKAKAALAIPQAWAQESVEQTLGDLVAEGEDLFLNETFDGNGRTCGTCHRPENNFTIDAEYIASLPAYDPLFVAEYVPELNYEHNGGRRFENPVLMRKFGLILANADGFGPDNDLSTFVMRSVPHTIGMRQTLTRPDRAEEFPSQRTGWGGDGAPSGVMGSLVATGSLRDFAIGAVIQHFPLTTYRRIDEDFRLPTPHELDAMEAFQLSLGRDSELDLVAGSPSELILANADAEAGKVLFVSGTPTSSPPNLSCNFCHRNAGANNRSGENRNFNTGVELFLINHPDETGEPRPVDGGFGTRPDGSFGAPIPNEDGGFGDMSFNNTSVIEAADTLPAFHNNTANTLEETILFYQSPEFAESRRGNRIDLDDRQVHQVAQFMRVINAIDNLENSAIPYANRAIGMLFDGNFDVYAYRQVVELAQKEAVDAMQVLKQGRMHRRDAQRSIRQAYKEFRKSLRIRVQVPIEKQAPELQDRLLSAIVYLEASVDAMRLN